MLVSASWWRAWCAWSGWNQPAEWLPSEERPSPGPITNKVCFVRTRDTTAQRYCTGLHELRCLAQHTSSHSKFDLPSSSSSSSSPSFTSQPAPPPPSSLQELLDAAGELRPGLIDVQDYEVQGACWMNETDSHNTQNTPTYTRTPFCSWCRGACGNCCTVGMAGDHRSRAS
jgi:hypothetical protein